MSFKGVEPVIIEIIVAFNGYDPVLATVMA